MVTKPIEIYDRLSGRALVGHSVEWAYKYLQASDHMAELLVGLTKLGNYIYMNDLGIWDDCYADWDRSIENEETDLLDDVFNVGRSCLYSAFNRERLMREFNLVKSRIEKAGVGCNPIQELMVQYEGIGPAIDDYRFTFRK